jgi:hypothetical protein
MDNTLLAPISFALTSIHLKTSHPNTMQYLRLPTKHSLEHEKTMRAPFMDPAYAHGKVNEFPRSTIG